MKSFTYKITKASGGVHCSGSIHARSMEHAQSKIMKSLEIEVKVSDGGDYFDSSYFLGNSKVFISISCAPTDWLKPNRRVMFENQGVEFITLEYKEYQKLQADKKALNYLKDDVDFGEDAKYCLDLMETRGDI